MTPKGEQLHLRNQAHIERELHRIADALDKLVTILQKTKTNDKQEEDKNNEGKH